MPRLFEVKIITKDTRLGAALVALEGIAYGKPEITPIRGARVSQGKVKATNGSGPLSDKLIEAVIATRQKEITKREITALVEAVGAKPSSSSSFATMMVRKGVLRRKGKGLYRVVAKG